MASGVRQWLAPALLLALVATGCTRDDGGEAVQVFAASSLTEAFESLEAGFEGSHPGPGVQLTFAGSQVLRLQIEQGAAADVFASANPEHMEALVDAGRVRAPQTFARNGLAIIVPPGNPAGLERFEDLPKASRIVVGTDGVPIGRYTQAMLAKAEPEFAAAVRRSIVSKEANVRLVRAKVELGEADAAIVYRTDVTDGVRAIEVPPELDVAAVYPIGVLTHARQAEGAAAFVAYVRSAEGRAALERHGFEPGEP